MRTGWAVQAGYTALCVAAVPPLRRRLFETFYRSHILLVLFSAAATLSHGGPLVLVGFGLWVVDVFFRLGLRAAFWNPHRARLTRLPSKVVRISLLGRCASYPKGKFTYRAGQYCFICVPKLGLLEWHPFSISSAPFQPEVQLHARVLGDWTERLHALAGEQPEEVEVLLDGPYGEPSVDLEGDRYKMFLLLSGGIGITPLQSVCNSLIDQGARGRPLIMLWFASMRADKHLLTSMVPNEHAPSKFRRTSSLPAVDEHDLQRNTTLPAVFEPILLTQTGTNTEIVDRYELLSHSRRKSIDLRSLTDKPATMFSFEIERRTERLAEPKEDKRDSSTSTSGSPSSIFIPLAELSARRGAYGEPSRAEEAPPDYLHTEFYLTRSRDRLDLARSSVASVSPATHSSLRFGRPDVDAMFETLKQLAIAKGERRVAVLTCGPAKLVASVRAACDAHSGDGVAFDLHSETFEF
jgi:NAD(P)H-flavin reductase